MCRGKFRLGLVPCNCSGGINLTKVSSDIGDWQAVATERMYSQPDGEQLDYVKSLCCQQSASSVDERDVRNSKLQPLVRRKMDRQGSLDSTSNETDALATRSPVEECFQSSFEFSYKGNKVQIDQSMHKDLRPVCDVLHSKHAGVYHSECECPTSHSRTLIQKDHPLPLHVKPLPVSPFDPGSNDMQPCQALTCPEVPPRPIPLNSKLCLKAIIPSPVLNKALDSGVEHKIINLPGSSKDLVAKKGDSSGLSDSIQTNLPYRSPLELTYDSDTGSTKSEIHFDSINLFDKDYSDIGPDPCAIFDELRNKEEVRVSSPLELTYDSDTGSTKSEIHLDSINVLDKDYSDIGPDPCAIFDELPNKEEVGYEVVRRIHLTRKYSSKKHPNRQVHVCNDELFGVEVKNDVGPKPKVLIDSQREIEQEVVSCTVGTTGKQKVSDTSHRPGLHRAWSQINSKVNSERSTEVIDSIFSPKRVYSCCKNRRKSSWSDSGVRRRNAQLKLVCNRRPRKIVVIGDMCTGKSALISAYCTDRFSDMYVPTILRSCQTDAEMEKEKIELVVIEVSGREDYFKLRKCAYRKTDAFILCYSTDNVSSLEKIKSHWLPEIQAHASNTPFVLVGTKKDNREAILDQMGHKCDKRNSQSFEDSYQSKIEKLVSTEQGYEMAISIGADSFLECSARYRDGTRHIFETITKIAVKKSRRKRKVQRTGDVCTIM